MADLVRSWWTLLHPTGPGAGPARCDPGRVGDDRGAVAVRSRPRRGVRHFLGRGHGLTWATDPRHRPPRPRHRLRLLDAVGSGGPHARATQFPTGFAPLDDVLHGGIRAQDLVLLGGRPGIGKTVASLQWARWMAMQGQTAIYVCYEHSPHPCSAASWPSSSARSPGPTRSCSSHGSGPSPRRSRSVPRRKHTDRRSPRSPTSLRSVSTTSRIFASSTASRRDIRNMAAPAASRPRPVRSARVAATASAWRSHRAGSARDITGRIRLFSISMFTRSAAMAT